ncbi:unnamed protein product [Rotaria magnacalcarata]|uniref:Uncharacterized protein n=1 Tax=Rotaria magnacalcarata TaxID=392030 RepID=A0A816MXV3_9BILA|nr:unnamed protein product [Rotaria magnacalcarata]CAF1631438.1 unnamed protein product [Rotaria magnacalcarata]CAF2023466.1 unnamed protein product [Rotaria magnacalcarata]CAF3789780.1 unnamed protein product [Rotaria magnacalcarata]CAF3809757.1 unnamed protein product [Rotaria magnacalcarata]
MKRITQILASIVFVIAVITVYLVFDFAINSATGSKTPLNKRSHHELFHHNVHTRDNSEQDHDAEHNDGTEHNDDNIHDDIKTTEKSSRFLSTSLHTKKSNRTVKHQNEHQRRLSNNEHHMHSTKRKTTVASLHAKPGNFHKGKTGVKVNKPQKAVRPQRKGPTKTKAAVQQKK